MRKSENKKNRHKPAKVREEELYRKRRNVVQRKERKNREKKQRKKTLTVDQTFLGSAKFWTRWIQDDIQGSLDSKL